jgi:hypothetical protein
VFRRDRSGIVAAVTGVLADDSGNVEDTSTTSGARRCVLDHRAHAKRIAGPADLRCRERRRYRARPNDMTNPSQPVITPLLGKPQ